MDTVRLAAQAQTVHNKRLVEVFCAHFAHGAIAQVLDMMHEDATWWVNGKPHLFAGAICRTKAQMATVWRALYAMLDGGLTLTVEGMVAEDDRVAAEVRSHAITRTGKVYDNRYHFLFTIRDGRIMAVKEYTDLMHSQEIFG